MVWCTLVILLCSCPLFIADEKAVIHTVSPAMEKARRFLSIDVEALDHDLPHTFHEALEKQDTGIFAATDPLTGEEIRVYVVDEGSNAYRIVVEQEYASTDAYDLPLQWDFSCQPENSRSVEMVRAFRYWEFYRRDSENFSLVLVDAWTADTFYLDDATQPYEHYADNWVYRADGTYDPVTGSITMDAVTYSKYVPRSDISEQYRPDSESPYTYTIEELYGHKVMRLCGTLNFIDLLEGQDGYEYIQILDVQTIASGAEDSFFIVRNSDTDPAYDDEAFYIGHAEVTEDAGEAVLLLWGNRFEESSLPVPEQYTFLELSTVTFKPGTQEGAEPDAWIMKSFDASGTTLTVDSN